MSDLLATAATGAVAQPTPTKVGRIHTLLTVQSVIIILVSINRLTTLTTGYVLGNDFLRWVDLLNMLVFPLFSLVAFYLLKKTIEYAGPAYNGRAHLAINIAFIIGIYLTAVSYGTHEVTNYLHARFCLPDDGSALCRIIVFNDDEFSHWVFFGGFILINTALMALQVRFPLRGRLEPADIWRLVANGLFIGAGVFANLAFEEIGLDLLVVAVLAVLSVGLLWRYGRQPLVIYYATAFGVGFAATLLYRGALL